MLLATIIIVAVLTALIFTLLIVALSSTLKNEKRELELGNRDAELKSEKLKESKKSSKIANIAGAVIGGVIALSLLAASVTAVIYKASGEQFIINNKVSLVIVTDSMNGYYNEDYKIELLTEASKKGISEKDIEEDQFKAGDLLTFSVVSDSEQLNEFEVYGYKTEKGKIITHRYIGKDVSGKLIFRGDNAGGRDLLVDRSQVILHYNNFKITYIGFFVLFSQSGFGLYAFISVILVYTLSEIYISKYEKLIKNRLIYIGLEKSKIKGGK